MIKKAIALTLVFLMAFAFVACSGGNKYNLSYTPDGSDKIDYIFYTEERVVYVVGGIMMVNIDEEPKLLEMAFSEGLVDIDELLESAKEDYEDGKIEATIYPDGSCEYCYDGFKMIVLNTHLRNIDIYFTPSTMGFFDIYNK